ncbi:unnamed protein product [Rhizophagus irregularis]|nr:unnamed protein product [Rhizophagus irregularis]
MAKRNVIYILRLKVFGVVCFTRFTRTLLKILTFCPCFNVTTDRDNSDDSYGVTSPYYCKTRILKIFNSGRTRPILVIVSHNCSSREFENYYRVNCHFNLYSGFRETLIQSQPKKKNA